MANIVQPSDLFLVQRGNDSRKCTGLDLHDSITGGLTTQIKSLESQVVALETRVKQLEDIDTINGGSY